VVAYSWCTICTGVWESKMCPCVLLIEIVLIRDGK